MREGLVRVWEPQKCLVVSPPTATMSDRINSMSKKHVLTDLKMTALAAIQFIPEATLEVSTTFKIETTKES